MALYAVTYVVFTSGTGSAYCAIHYGAEGSHQLLVHRGFKIFCGSMFITA